ncbi:hypothetical protein A8B79_05485 [Balneola sp. EhC07]|uniref:hypothetical protein n=1 Tax=Balneola sp. EhC07 TaxID=1849360 RepID=UPI0007F34A9F|nr:hypothetical protein [Balneola sp. EhC07]OAN61873.1 hypothetical protein A8B79_05485 [Balneola sp. EhC07]
MNFEFFRWLKLILFGCSVIIMMSWAAYEIFTSWILISNFWFKISLLLILCFGFTLVPAICYPIDFDTNEVPSSFFIYGLVAFCICLLILWIGNDAWISITWLVAGLLSSENILGKVRKR